MAKSKAPLTVEQAEMKMMKKEKAKANWNSFLAIVLAIALTVGVVAVGKSTAEKRLDTAPDSSVSGNVDNSTNNGNGGSSNDYLIDEDTGEVIVDENGDPVINPDASTGDENSEENKAPDRELPANPAEWTKAEVVNFYKKAAQNSKSAKSVQKMTMDNGMTVKLSNKALEFLIGLAEPVIQAALKANSTEFDGITGGYDNLVPSDAQSARAYKEGKYTVVEMLMVEQVDDAYGDTFSGTVGHAISVVGNIAVVADQFPQFTINFKDAYGALTYKNPRVRVKINEKGVIEKGTWSYVVDVDIKNLQIESVVVEHGATEINYVITTGGGF